MGIVLVNMERGPKPRLGGDTLEGSKPADTVRSKKKVGILAVGALVATIAGHSAEAGDRGPTINYDGFTPLVATENDVHFNDDVFLKQICHLPGGKEGQLYSMIHPTTQEVVVVPPGGFIQISSNIVPFPHVFIEGPGYYDAATNWVPCDRSEIGKSFKHHMAFSIRDKEIREIKRREWAKMREDLASR